MSGQDAGRNPYNVYGRMFREIEEADELDFQFGFARYTEGPPRIGWLVNLQATTVPDPEWISGRSAIDLYFIEEDGSYFKATLPASMYMFVVCKEGHLNEVEDYLKRKFDSTIESIKIVVKEDMDLPNHLVGNRREVLKLTFRNINDLNSVKKIIQPIINKNISMQKTESVYERLQTSNAVSKDVDFTDYMIDLREHDIPVHLRIAIDYQIRVGLWYCMQYRGTVLEVALLKDKHVRPDPVVLAFDIETTKQPLKFPDSSIDQVMMISYMVDGQGFLIVNREIVVEDIEDFEYSPKPEYPGPFSIFNEPNEEHLLVRFFEHIQQIKPAIFVTYNGDFFDWPFIEKRASVYGIDMKHTLGFSQDAQEEYKSKHAAHMDAFKWVKRDSYLPAGSHGLKAVTRAKLGYDPVELDPEVMLEYAQSKPQVLASYSASDSVATYFLYQKYVHPFIFSLCNIIPLNPDEVLRKGSGTLCETLLMAEAFSANILMPNKSGNSVKKFHKGHLLESETYVGGHVEALESGVFRSDIPTAFNVSTSTIQQLIDELDDTLQFFLRVEGKIDLEQVVNYEEVKQSIVSKLEALKDSSKKMYNPIISHLDVAAMYPNIILTNRLQPHAVVTEATCAACVFNKPGKTCQRKLPWSWRGEFYAAKRNEYKMIVNQLESEKFKNALGKQVAFNELAQGERDSLIEKRLSSYCRKVYKKIHESEVVAKTDIVCQKENTFYIDTVKSFRDRRYEYKGLHKVWKGKLEKALSDGDPMLINESVKMNILYDSLQLAHKCIMNSFYGYVMRKGARWFSMEMAGIICEIGSSIIQVARQLIEKIGRPLELDTDGIWCMFPEGFPDTFNFVLRNGKKCKMSYMCSMLNSLVYNKFTNHQYQILIDPTTHTYKQISENSIFFEIDGPYHAMILPSSTEEDKLLKKRYAVLNHNASIAELKGFEIKRRGELKLIKIFQSYIFKTFLDGTTLPESYESAAKVCNYWLDILYSKGENMNTNELIDLISENRNMSKTLESYGEQKSTSISTAKRLAEFLGDEMIKDKGLSCRFIISAKPVGDQVASRAIPVAIFSAEQHVKEHYLKKWLKDSHLVDFDIRSILDWNYYLERFESVVQKLVTIPAAMQHVQNPVPRVKHPSWVMRRYCGSASSSGARQTKLSDIFTKPREESEIFLQKSPNSVVVPEEKPISPVVDFVRLLHSDYPKFIHESKARWSQLRKEIASGPKVSSKTQMHNLFNASMLKEPWYLLGVVPTQSDGIFNFLVYQRKGIFQIKVKITRKFYINSRIPDVMKDLREVHFRLPRCFKRFYLYEYSVSESEFVQNINLEAFKTHPDIDAIYESMLPLELRPLLQLGSYCKPERTSITTNNSNYQWEFENLTAMSITDNYAAYSSIPPISQSFEIGFLWEIGDLKLNHRFMAFILGKSCLISVVDPSGNKNVPSLKNLLDTSISSLFDFANLEVHVLAFKSIQAAFKSIQKFVSDCKTNSSKIPFILHQIQNSNVELKFLSEYFHCSIEGNSQSVQNELPVIDWQRAAARKFANALVQLDGSVSTLERLSRYSNIPFVNLAQSHCPLSFVTDIIFGRALQDNSHLLWYSSGDRIDLGGREMDWSINNMSEHVNDIYFCKSDYYRTICFEISIANLYLNTILASSQINELENSAVNDVLDEGDYKVVTLLERRINRNLSFNVSLSDNQYSKSAFNILKGILTSWYKEALSQEDAVSVKLLENFDSWFLNPKSSLYDALLVGKVKSMAKKVVLQLIGLVSEHGGEVIFGSCDKLVICCKKQEPDSAKEWIEFVLKSLGQSELFAWLDLSVSNCFCSMLWLDNNNYFGRIVNDQEPSSSSEQDNSSFTGSFSIFNEYSGSEMRNILINLIGEYYCSFLTPDSLTEMQLAHFSGKCFDFLQQVVKMYNATVAIEVCKTLISFLCIDSHFCDYHLKLKRNCFLLLGLSEFSSKANESEHDSHRILIDDFICPECQRASSLLISMHEPIQCMHCRLSFDGSSVDNKSLFELFLINHTNSLLEEYFVQDLSCLSCKKIKVGHLGKICKCAGSYGNTWMKRNSLVNELNVLMVIAEKCQMKLLSSLISKMKVIQ